MLHHMEKFKNDGWKVSQGWVSADRNLFLQAWGLNRRKTNMLVQLYPVV